jgi:hypothetical protein
MNTRRTVLVALLAGASASASAQSFISMGRLFTTPSERAQLDALRNSGPSTLPGAAAAGAPGMPGAAGTPMTGTPGAAPGASTSAAAEAAPPAPAQVQLSGIIRRSNGRTTVFVNNEAQEAQPANQGKAARVQVEGRAVVLKPGQTYDPATGAIHETGR